MSDRSHLGTIFVENAKRLASQAYPGEQFVIRLRAPKCAAAAALAMKRVCVDGPVFDANAVFPPAATPPAAAGVPEG